MHTSALRPARATRRASTGVAPGIAPGVAAGLVWGVAFVVPERLADVPASQLTLGRYLVYGLLSVLLLLRDLPAVRALGRRDWLAALAFALAGNVGYYLLLVLAIEQAGAPLTAIGIGAIPVCVALAGTLHDRALPLTALYAPLALTLAGIAAVDVAALTGAGDLGVHGPRGLVLGSAAML